MESEATKGSKQLIQLVVEIATLVAVLSVLTALVREQLEIAQRVGNGPSSQADAPSEADVITSSMHYYLEGFLTHMGLPDRG